MCEYFCWVKSLNKTRKWKIGILTPNEIRGTRTGEVSLHKLILGKRNLTYCWYVWAIEAKFILVFSSKKRWFYASMQKRLTLNYLTKSTLIDFTLCNYHEVLNCKLWRDVDVFTECYFHKISLERPKVAHRLNKTTTFLDNVRIVRVFTVWIIIRWKMKMLFGIVCRSRLNIWIFLQT